jgi:hypothetical protein
MRFAVATAFVLCAAVETRAHAEEPPPPTAEQIEAAVKADAAGTTASANAAAPKPEEEAPPPLPRRKGIVLESSLGALVFVGRFRQIAPPAPWLRVQLGYELFSWLMFFGQGELAFTDTSVAQDPSKARAFPMFGFGGGVRLTVHLTDRVAFYGQGELGALKADIANNGLANVGFRDAESLGLSFGARVGLEWYQLDRHIALGLAGGVRDAKGFAKSGPQSDTPLMVDASVFLRYTF